MLHEQHRAHGRHYRRRMALVGKILIQRIIFQQQASILTTAKTGSLTEFIACRAMLPNSSAAPNCQKAVHWVGRPSIGRAHCNGFLGCSFQQLLQSRPIVRRLQNLIKCHQIGTTMAKVRSKRSTSTLNRSKRSKKEKRHQRLVKTGTTRGGDVTSCK